MKRFSILTKDLEHCIECKRFNVELHEVFYGANRNKSIQDGCVIPLCKEKHHRGNLVGIHNDKELNLKYKKLMQLKWQEVYNKDADDFIKKYGRNYL